MQQYQRAGSAGGGGAAMGPATAAAAAAVRRRCEGTAMGAITLDLRPGQGIGPFSLGMMLLCLCVVISDVDNEN
jgi:hypothetical protein